MRSLDRVRRAQVLLLACSTACVLLAAPSANAYSTNWHIAAFVGLFANGTPAEVRCPDSAEEWGADLGDPVNAEEIYARTFAATAVWSSAGTSARSSTTWPARAPTTARTRSQS